MGKRDDTRKRDIASLQAIHGLLKEVVESIGAGAPPELIRALDSQSRLAKYSDPERGITGMSLNHFKAIAIQANVGFDVIDKLRLLSLYVIAKSTTAPPEVMAETLPDELSRLRAEKTRLTDELRIAREDLAILQRAYDERCRQARRYAEKASAAVKAQCRLEQQALDRSLSLCRRLDLNHNVIPME